MSLSLAEQYALLDDDQRRVFDREFFPSDAALAARAHDWEFWGRPEQIWRPGPETYTLMCAGRGFGKLLALDTTIPTTEGWKRNGDLEVGDHVFGPDGTPTRVVATFDRLPERAWRVRFSDGTHVDAGGEHLWCTWTHRDRKAWNRGQNCDGPLPDRWWQWTKTDRHGRPTGVGPSVLDTDAIVATLVQGKRGDRNHSIPTTAPIVLPAVDLPIDPWLLGYWLGNGNTDSGALTTHPEDFEPVSAAARSAGFDLGKIRMSDGRAPHFTVLGLSPRLRALGVLGNKHVPDAYLWSSVTQRLALLRGLLDSDGYAECSKVEFCSTRLVLAQAVLHLGRSLGERPAIYEGRATLNGKDCGPKWRVCWRPARFNPFALPRKSARVSMEHGAQASRLFHRMIVAVEPIPVAPMRCIEVDNESHLYLAGEGMVPTHNTTAGAHATHYVAAHPELCGGRPSLGPDDIRAGTGAVIGIAGRTAKDVNRTMVDGDTGIMASCDPALRPRWNKQDGELVWPNGVVARLMTGDVPTSFRGPNFGWLWADELPHWSRAEASWSAATDALRKSSKGQHPRALITSTPLGTALILALAFLLLDGQPIKAPPGTDPLDIVQGYLRNPETRVIGGSTYDNASNLSERFLSRTVGKYAGTVIGDQEIGGLIRLAIPGALWIQDWFHRCEDHEVPTLDRRAVFVDPTASDGIKVKRSEDVCECGIIGAGMVSGGRRVYSLHDRSLVARPRDWADQVVTLALEIDAQTIVAEGNNGGDMVREAVESAWLRRRGEHMGRRKPAIELVTATRNKTERAEFAAPAWEQGKVIHAGPARRWVGLEGQMTSFDPNRPHAHQPSDRMDAAVWQVLYFLGDGTDRTRVRALTDAEGMARVLAEMRARAQGQPRGRRR